jgi:hypothetical protein
VVLAGVATVSAAPAQGIRHTGEGVICAYGIYTELQFTAKVCNWERVPFDDTLDRAVADIESYILANASDPSVVERTRANMLAGEAIWNGWPAAERQGYCERQAKAQIMGGIPIRATDPRELEQAVRELLSVPGEPTLGSCL